MQQDLGKEYCIQEQPKERERDSKLVIIDNLLFPSLFCFFFFAEYWLLFFIFQEKLFKKKKHKHTMKRKRAICHTQYKIITAELNMGTK